MLLPECDVTDSCGCRMKREEAAGLLSDYGQCLSFFVARSAPCFSECTFLDLFAISQLLETSKKGRISVYTNERGWTVSTQEC